MSFFRSHRARYFFTACLALAVVLAQGLRVQLHAHEGAAAATVHAHVKGASAPLDHHKDTTADVDVSFDATIKLVNILPLLALVAIVLGFGLTQSPVKFSRSAIARPRFLDPPYLAPPGHAPPR